MDRIKLFKESFEYIDGSLFWLERPLSHFKTYNGMVATNSRFAGKKVTTRATNKGKRTNYLTVRFMGRLYLQHRVIWEMLEGEIPAGLQIDHIDGNGENNKIDNLRLVTNQQNSRNFHISKNNTSGHTGVTFNKNANKWLAQITVSGENIYLGIYKDIKKAIKVRKEAEIRYQFHENHGRRNNK
jgi:hypothetical protein